MKANALRLAQTLCLLAKRHALALVLVCLGLAVFTSRYQLAINFTESLPGTVFLIDKKDRRVEKGARMAGDLSADVDCPSHFADTLSLRSSRPTPIMLSIEVMRCPAASKLTF